MNGGMMATRASSPRASWQARIALALFDLLYHNLALYWLASTIPFAGRWRTWQRLALPRLMGRDVLELGCGPGWLLADMAQAGYRCQAIDASPQMVAAARATLRRRNLDPAAARVVQGRAQDLPFASESLDCVVSTFPAPYIADPATLREIARVLRPGGRLIVVEGAQLVPRNPLLWACVQMQRVVYGRRADSDAPPSGLMHLIAQADAGIVPEQEIVSDLTWRAYLVIGRKLRP
jgi:SAM-dependent methyltransferase